MDLRIVGKKPKAPKMDKKKRYLRASVIENAAARSVDEASKRQPKVKARPSIDPDRFAEMVKVAQVAARAVKLRRTWANLSLGSVGVGSRGKLATSRAQRSLMRKAL